MRSKNHKYLVAVACLGLFGFAGNAQADLLAAGALYGGVTQDTAVCYVYNAGRSAVTLRNFRITDLAGVKLAITTGECTTSPFTLAAGKACGIATLSGGGAVNCRVSVGPSKTDVRGVFEIRDINGAVLQNTPLR